MTCLIQLCRTCRAAVDYDCLCRGHQKRSHFYVTSGEWDGFKRGTWPEDVTQPGASPAREGARASARMPTRP